MRRGPGFFALLVLVCIGTAGCVAIQEETVDSPRPSAPSQLYERALAQYQNARYAQARDLFHQYLEENPKSLLFEVALYYLGHCYQMLGDEKEALTFYNRIVTSYGDDDFWGTQAMNRIQQIKATDESSGK